MLVSEIDFQFSSSFLSLLSRQNTTGGKNTTRGSKPLDIFIICEGRDGSSRLLISKMDPS